MRRRTGNSTRDERGAAAVEFALVAVPLLMVIAGIVNFGAVFAQQLALDNAIRAGARAGVVDRGTTAVAPDAVARNQFTDTVFAKTQVTTVAVTYPAGGVGSTCKGSTFGGLFKMRGTTTATFLIPWPLPGVSKTVNLASQAEFQCEYK